MIAGKSIARLTSWIRDQEAAAQLSPCWTQQSILYAAGWKTGTDHNMHGLPSYHGGHRPIVDVLAAISSFSRRYWRSLLDGAYFALVQKHDLIPVD